MSYSTSRNSSASKPYNRHFSSPPPRDDRRQYEDARRPADHRAEPKYKAEPKYRAETKVSIPQMRYKLSKRTQAQTLTEIAMKTSGFFDLSPNEADWVQRDVRSREFSSFSSLPVPDNCDGTTIQKIIGNDNYYLKLTIKNHDMDFIYYDDYTKEFQFWGEYQCCIKAMNELRYRIHMVIAREEEQARQEPPVTAEINPKPHYNSKALRLMSKMGYKKGTGMGLSQKGRLEPIDPIEELGGRTYNRNYGFGYTGCAPEVQEPEVVELEEVVEPKVVEQEPEIVAQEPVVVEQEPEDLNEVIEFKPVYIKETQPKLVRSVSVSTSCSNQ